MDLNEIERFVLAVFSKGAKQTLAFSRTKGGWGCVINDGEEEYERTFDFPEDVTYYIGERTLMADRVDMLERG